MPDPQPPSATMTPQDRQHIEIIRALIADHSNANLIPVTVGEVRLLLSALESAEKERGAARRTAQTGGACSMNFQPSDMLKQVEAVAVIISQVKAAAARWPHDPDPTDVLYERRRGALNDIDFPALAAHLRRLEEAAGFYADQSNWRTKAPDGKSEPVSIIMRDTGMIAARAIRSAPHVEKP